MDKTVKRRAASRGAIFRLLKGGSTRLVFVIGRFAVKVPRPWPMRRLRKGRISNQLEVALFKRSAKEGWDELCPIIAALPLGIANLMPFAERMSIGEFGAFSESPEYPDRYPDAELYEHKADDWAFLAGRPVVVDYAYWVQKESAGLGPTPLSDYVPRAKVARDPET